jgi:CHAT domain-containing protein
LREAEQLTKAEALRRTQLAFISGAIRPEGSGTASQRSVGCMTCETADEKTALAEADYRHPYYWAPFILMGNWL